jgi:hypothetical protein
VNTSAQKQGRDASASAGDGVGVTGASIDLQVTANPCPTAHSTRAKQEAATCAASQLQHTPKPTLNTTTATHAAHPRSLLRCPRTTPTAYTRSNPHFHKRTMVSGIVTLLLSGVALLNVQAQTIPAADLVGTWSSKSNSTLTGDVRTTHPRRGRHGTNKRHRASTTPRVSD